MLIAFVAFILGSFGEVSWTLKNIKKTLLQYPHYL
jgi:hypothetical protein